MLQLLNRKSVRYIFTGISNTLIGFLVIYFFYNVLNLSYFFSTILGYLVGFINGFLLNKHYTFKNNDHYGKVLWKYLIVFVMAYLVSYYSGLWISKLVVNYFFTNTDRVILENIAVFIGGLIYIVLSYFGNSLFTFNKKINSKEI
ncbi:hypothetical protein GC093_06950 [Paenibacillus sp. LMG 31456]|uniref:GtrA/DPMS transmembrane domain-containing protein n=1 Tax=Paenibacillus foliorum TaxID=2654974 RepID=A0A972GRP7_9BACL|nr:hypothetical protein [Paenibacillus foliorum]